MGDFKNWGTHLEGNSLVSKVWDDFHGGKWLILLIEGLFDEIVRNKDTFYVRMNWTYLVDNNLPEAQVVDDIVDLFARLDMLVYQGDELNALHQKEGLLLWEMYFYNARLALYEMILVQSKYSGIRNRNEMFFMYLRFARSVHYSEMKCLALEKLFTIVSSMGDSVEDILWE